MVIKVTQKDIASAYAAEGNAAHNPIANAISTEFKTRHILAIDCGKIVNVYVRDVLLYWCRTLDKNPNPYEELIKFDNFKKIQPFNFELISY